MRDLGNAFWRFWTASTVSALGDGLTFVALPLLAARLTRDPAQIALVQTGQYAAWLAFGLVAGALADRWERRRIMAATDAVRAMLFGAFALAVATGSASLGLVIGLAFVSGVAGILNQNAASAFLPSLVGRQQLEVANTWLQAGLTVPSSLVGPALAGLLFAAAASLPFAIDAVSFAVSGVLVLTLARPVAVERPAPPPLWSSLVEGMRYLWGSQVLRTLCLLLAVVNGTAAAVVSVAVLYVQDVLGLGERGFGLLLGAFALGGLGGMALTSWARERLGTSGIVRAVLLVQAGTMLTIAAAGSVPVTAVCFVLTGATGGLWNVATISLRQRIVPDQLLGRVTSAYRLVGLGSMPVGSATGGLIARGFGLSAPFVLAGIVSLLGALAAVRWLPQRVIQDATSAAAS